METINGCTVVPPSEAPEPVQFGQAESQGAYVVIVGTFPPDSHPPIIYPVALTPAAGPAAHRYLAFLRSPVAKTIFEAHGFTFLPKPS